MRIGSFARDGLTALAVAVGYYLCAVIGTVLSLPPSGFAVIWPATPFLIAMLLVLPQRLWWLCAATVVPTHFLMAASLQPGAPFVVALTQIGGNFLFAGATVAAIGKAKLRDGLFESIRSMALFILVAGLAVPAIVTSLVLPIHMATGWTDDFGLAWRQWMIAQVFPTITVPPAIVLLAEGGLTGRPQVSPTAGRELGLLSLLLFALSFLAFGADALHWPALFLAPLPLLLWAAVRLGVGGSAVSLLTFAGAIIAQALRQNGPFAAHSPIETVASLQTFLIVISIPLLLLAALMDERRRTAELLRQSEARMQVTAASTDTGLWQWDVATRSLWQSDHCQSMLGVVEAQSPYAFLDSVHADDRGRLEKVIQAALGSDAGRATDEFRLRAADGDRWLSLLTHTELDRNGAPIRVSGVFRDVTDRVRAEQEAGRLRLLLLRLQDDERRRIAEELHDSTAQHLVAADLNLINLKTRVGAKGQELLTEISKSVSEALAEIRTFSFLLYPPQLSEAGLSKVLGKYVPGFERRTGIRTTLRINSFADTLPTEQQHALLRITQESLGNVHRHADATKVSVCLRYVAGVVHLIVRDDGRGIPADAGQQLGDRLRLGVGIPAMSARVRQLGGRIDVSSRARGTTIHVAIPLQPGDEEAIGAAERVQVG